MARAVLEFLRWQLEEAFARKPEHSLLGNLSPVTDDVLNLAPPTGGRTIRDFIVHCASVKRMQVNHAFSDETMMWTNTWDGEGRLADAHLAALTAWLQRAHQEAEAAVGALQDDRELDALRPTYWGEKKSTREIIDAILMHDIYHAGEINHLRGLLQNADKFPKGGTT